MTNLKFLEKLLNYFPQQKSTSFQEFSIDQEMLPPKNETYLKEFCLINYLMEFLEQAWKFIINYEHYCLSWVLHVENAI